MSVCASPVIVMKTFGLICSADFTGICDIAISSSDDLNFYSVVCHV